MSRGFKILLLILIVIGMPAQLLLRKSWAGQAAQPEPHFLVKETKPPKAARPLYVPGELIVKFKKEASEEKIEDLKIEQEAEEEYESRFTRSKRWKVSGKKSVEEWKGFFEKHPLVEYAEPNYYAYASMVPNDPGYQYQWHFDNAAYGGIQMESAWDMETGVPNVKVAVADTGVAYENYPGPGYWHRDTYNAYGGSGYSWWCGLSTAPAGWFDPNNTPPGYGNGWKQYLQHPFDLTTVVGTVTFSYQIRSHTERNYDYVYVEVSSDGGTTWDQLKSYTGPRFSFQVKWQSDSLNLTSYAGSNILLRFRFNSDDTWSDEDGLFDSDGAVYIDEIKLEDDSGTLFYDDVESGAGLWETTEYEQAPDLAGTSFAAGYDFINSDAHPNDDEGHGTHVAGTVAQTTNNNLGVAGIAFNTTVIPVKVLNAAGSGTYQHVADGIIYAVDNGAKIINMSLGGSSPATVLENAVAYAYNQGVTVFAACGNSNVSSCDYPAAYNNYVIAVGATQYDETRAPYSNYGSSLDIVAPGGNTDVDQNGDGYADGVLQNTFGDTPVDWGYWFYQGTSMSTPHAAGAAALLLARDSGLTPDQIRNALESTAEDLGSPGRDNTYGWGLIDAQAALQSISPAVSISLISPTSPGSVDFGILPLDTSQDTTPSGINDAESVRIDTGPANLDIKSTVFSDNGNTWSLASSNGIDQVQWEFATSTTGTWWTFSTADTLYNLADDMVEGAEQDIYLRITMPTETSSSAQYSSTVTIVATAP